MGRALEHGAAAGAPLDLQHHRFWREPAGCVAGDRSERAAQRDRPSRDGACRHAAVAGPRARARQAPRRARHGGCAHQPRLAQHAVRRPADLGPADDNPRPARPAACSPAGRDARSRDPVLPIDADIRRGPRTASIAAAVRFERARAAGGRVGAGRKRRGDRLRHRHSAANSTSMPTPTTSCACSRT